METQYEEPITDAPNTPAKTSIRPDVSKMIKTANGSYHKDDALGHALAGLTVDQVKTIGTDLGVEVGKYAHLNPGQQRMNIGNALRRISADPEALEKIVNLAGTFKEGNAAKAEAEAAEKAAAKAAKAAEKAAKPKKEKKAKVADSAEGEGSVE